MKFSKEYEAEKPSVLGPAQIQKNITLLEELVLAADLSVEYLDYHYEPRTQLLDVAIATVAKHPRGTDVYTIAKTEDIDPGYDNDRLLIRLIREVSALWIDPYQFANSSQNLLRYDDGEEDWKRGLQRSLAHVLATKGKVMKDGDGYYGWVDYDFGHDHRGKKKADAPEVVAVIEVREDAWGEFEGTFVDATELHHGVTGTAVFSDGQIRKMRYETNLDSLIREVLH